MGEALLGSIKANRQKILARRSELHKNSDRFKSIQPTFRGLPHYSAGIRAIWDWPMRAKAAI